MTTYSDLELIRDCSEIIDSYLYRLCQAKSVGSKEALDYMTYSAVQKRHMADILGAASNHEICVIAQIHALRNAIAHSLPGISLSDETVAGNVAQLRQLVHEHTFTERELVAMVTRRLVQAFRVRLMDGGNVESIPVRPWDLIGGAV